MMLEKAKPRIDQFLQTPSGWKFIKITELENASPKQEQKLERKKIS